MATEFSFKNNLKAELYEAMTANQTTIKLKHLVNSSDPAVRLAAWPRLDSVSQSHPVSFFLTLEDKISGKCEIIICTGVYANTDDYIQFVCARGMDGTTAVAHSVDTTIVENREIATFLNNLSNIYWTIASGDIFNSVVSLTGNQTIAGVKTLTANPVIKNNGPTIHLQQTDITKGTNPSSVNQYALISIVDSVGIANTNRTGHLSNIVNTAGLTITELAAYQFASGSTDYATIGVYCSADGNTKYATAPTPTTGDNSTKIATTEWVNANTSSLAPAMMYNTREVLTTSGTWAAPVTGWYKVTCIGGGGGGGGAIKGAATSSNGGGGGSGYIVTSYRYLTVGQLYSYTIGAGGIGGIGGQYTASGLAGGDGGITSFDSIIANGGQGAISNVAFINYPTSTGGKGQTNGQTHCGYYVTGSGYGIPSAAGNGASNGSAYGGGGGGGACTNAGVTSIPGLGGSNGSNGNIPSGSATHGNGGAGGSGAVILEYFNPAVTA